MTLSFSALTQGDQLRDFWCQLPELEIVLDVLSAVTAKGDIIVSACIADEDGRIELPPDAFDGQPFTDPLRQLEKQWQAALTEPVGRAASDHDWHIALTQRRVKVYKDRINQLTLTLHHFEHFKGRVDEGTMDELRRGRLIHQYNTALTKYRRHLNQAQMCLQANLEKLGQLQG